MPMKILTILGTRPSFIKAAPISRTLAATDDVEEVLVHTGQHYSQNMDAIFFTELGLPKPAYHLDINNLAHGPMVGRMLEAISKIIEDESPNWMLVFGDTNSTLAGALAARLNHIPLAHVEAGLRSFDESMPEEVNRKMTDQMSRVLFCPTPKAIDNLDAEGFNANEKTIVLTGDVMLDAARLFTPQARRPEGLEYTDKSTFVLATIHRAENTDDPDRLIGIFTALETISRETQVVLPLHPRTQTRLDAAAYDFSSSPIRFIEPVGYLEMIWLLKSCTMLLTDGGGLQKEAFFFDRPCVTLRDSSEWTELFESGVNILAGYAPADIIAAYETMRDKTLTFGQKLYGDGHACEHIIKTLFDV